MQHYLSKMLHLVFERAMLHIAESSAENNKIKVPESISFQLCYYLQKIRLRYLWLDV